MKYCQKRWKCITPFLTSTYTPKILLVWGWNLVMLSHTCDALLLWAPIVGPPFLAFVASFSLLLLYTPAILKLPGKFSFLFCFLLNGFGKSCGTAVCGSRKSVLGGRQRNIECWGYLSVFSKLGQVIYTIDEQNVIQGGLAFGTGMPIFLNGEYKHEISTWHSFELDISYFLI